MINKKYRTTRLLFQDNTSSDNQLENKSRKGEGGLRTKGYFKKSYADKALVSIIHQTYDNVEYIIIDGGSTDGIE